jgi:hypothetical protein
MKIISPSTKEQIAAAKKLLLKIFKQINIGKDDLDVCFDQPDICSTIIALENKKVNGVSIAQHKYGYCC